MAKIARVETSGSPRQRGRTYGEGLRALIRARDEAWKHDIAAHCKVPPRRFLAAFVSETDFVPAIRRHTPDLLEEVNGIAEGANLSFEDVLAAQLMDEQWWYADAFKRRHHCSSFASLDRRAGSAVVAQTMDLPGWMNGFQTALVVREPRGGGTQTILTVAGMIGLCGMAVRAAGSKLGLCVNTLSQLASNNAGLPVAFVSRGVLAQPDLAAARRFLQTVPHASGQNYILSDGQDLVDLECSAGGAVAWTNGGPGGSLVWHTNHPLASHDRRRTASGRGFMAPGANSLNRMTALDAALSSRTRPLDAAGARSVLADRSHRRHPISRDLKGSGTGFTFAGVIWDLGRVPVAEIAPGPPATTAFERIAMTQTADAHLAAAK